MLMWQWSDRSVMFMIFKCRKLYNVLTSHNMHKNFESDDKFFLFKSKKYSINCSS